MSKMAFWNSWNSNCHFLSFLVSVIASIRIPEHDQAPQAAYTSVTQAALGISDWRDVLSVISHANVRRLAMVGWYMWVVAWLLVGRCR